MADLFCPRKPCRAAMDMTAGASVFAGTLELGVPITERLLRRIPGPRWALITIWALAVLMTPIVLAGARLVSGVATDLDGVAELAPPGVLA